MRRFVSPALKQLKRVGTTDSRTHWWHSFPFSLYNFVVAENKIPANLIWHDLGRLPLPFSPCTNEKSTCPKLSVRAVCATLILDSRSHWCRCVRFVHLVWAQFDTCQQGNNKNKYLKVEKWHEIYWRNIIQSSSSCQDFLM